MVRRNDRPGSTGRRAALCRSWDYRIRFTAPGRAGRRQAAGENPGRRPVDTEFIARRIQQAMKYLPGEPPPEEAPMWAMIVKEFRQLRRDRRTLAMMIVLPVLLLVVFGYAASFDVTVIPVAVAGPGAAGLDLRAPFQVAARAPCRGCVLGGGRAARRPCGRGGDHGHEGHGPDRRQPAIHRQGARWPRCRARARRSRCGRLYGRRAAGRRPGGRRPAPGSGSSTTRG